MTKLRFDTRLFNPLYWHIDAALHDRAIRKLLIYGGSSAAKTYSIAQCIVYNGISINTSALVFRKESTTIDGSVLADFKTNARKVNGGYKFFEVQSRRIFSKRSVFDFGGMDDPEKIKGISKYQITFLNELSKFDESDFDEVERRLRGRPNQKIIGDWNPIDETHWIKTSLIDREEWTSLPVSIAGNPLSALDPQHSWKKINRAGDTVLIKTTYRDNWWVTGSPDGKYGFVDRHTIANFENMRVRKPNQYAIYGLGEWGSFRVGGEFWKSFDIDRHVSAVEFLPNKTVHVSVDINRIPYITQSLWQISDRQIRQFGELPASDPENTAPKAAKMLADCLDRLDYHDVVFVYGDASGKTKSAIDGRSFYGVYLRELAARGVKIADRIMKGNPSVSMTGAFVNEIYAGNTPFSIVIGDGCKLSKTDYNTVKEAADGTMVKEHVTDPVTGVKYEKNGHFSDAKRYFICMAFKKEYDEFRKRKHF